MANSSDSFQTAIAAALNIDEKDVAAKLDGLKSINQWEDLINAVSDGNESEIDSIVNSANQDGDVNPVLTTTAPGKAAPTPQDDQGDASSSQEDEQTNEGMEGAEEGFYGHGDEVLIDGKIKASVATPRGPNGTIGCIVPGKSQRMYAATRVTRCNEAILGQAMLPGLLRMQELAGLAPSVEHMPVQIAKIRTVDVMGDDEAQSQPVAVITDVDPPDIVREDRFGFFKSLR